MCDTQPSVIGGAAREFVLSGRLDNLASSFCALKAMLAAGGDGSGSLKEETGVRMIALFDNEEVGSESTAGAGGTVLSDALRRTTVALCKAGLPCHDARQVSLHCLPSLISCGTGRHMTRRAFS